MGQECQYLAKNVSFGPNLARFWPKILIFMGVRKVLVPTRKNHLGNLFELDFGRALDQMGQKCPYLANTFAVFW